VSHRAQEVGSRREAIDQQSRRVEQAVAREHTGSPSDDEVCAEHEALWAVWAAAEALPAVKQRECAATGSAMGVSLGQIITWCALILSKRRVPSRATVGRWVAHARERAGGSLAVLERACQVGVMLRCLEEMFCITLPCWSPWSPTAWRGWRGTAGQTVQGQRGAPCCRRGPPWRGWCPTPVPAWHAV